MWSGILLPLAVGLAIFLFGMKVMELALQHWAGPLMKKMIETSTETPWRGLLTGTILTALVQSSSAITVITIGMVNAGLLTFPRTLGIILGTNIGTCMTTELIGMNLHRYALPLLVGSLSIWLASWLIRLPGKSGAALRSLTLAVSGFSAVLLGMEVMQSIVPALQTRGLFTWFLEHSQKSLLWGIWAGTILTALIQSSTACIAIAMGLASSQAISLELGIAIVLGANIGTCVTALIASIGGSRSGRFVAWSHVLLNVGGAVLFYPLIPLLHAVTALLTESPSAQLAHAQTLYNIVCSLLALPICYMKWIDRLQPERDSNASIGRSS